MPSVRRIERSVDRALDRWRGHRLTDSNVGTPLLGSGLRSQTTRTGWVRTSVRLLIWLWAAFRFYWGIGIDKIRRRDTFTRRAVRLRNIFEELGPTFVKVAQQLSVRADLLPLEYCQELSLLVDSVPPFAFEHAREIIERVAGAPLEEVFDEFVREPIGSASIACVYKARLRTGDMVAVKVRRPAIAEQLERDVRALRWILRATEWLGVFKPDFSRTLRAEFGRMLLEEVDFVREARNAELFRAEAARAKFSYIQAPRVYFALSAEDVLVIEFVTGVFLSEILRALQSGNRAELERIRGLGIDLPVVARRLVQAAHWELIESLVFHADPHPGNICVQPGNVLMFLDFGSCGRLTGKYRRIWQRFYYELTQHNVQEMVQTAIAILEPLPPIDIEGFSREIELMFWDWVYAMESEHAEWWEKASGLLWMKFADAARRYQAPMSSEIVRIFRATFLYDTTIFRLSLEVNMLDEFRRYQREAGRRAKRRLRRAFWRRVEKGLTNSDYMEIDDALHMARQIFGRVQHYLDTPAPDFARVIGKLSYTANLLLRMAALGITIYVCAVIGLNGYALITGRYLSVWLPFTALANQQWFRITVALVTLLLIRKAVMKFQEYDSDNRKRGS